MSRSLYPWRKRLQYPFDRRLCRPQSLPGSYGKERNLLHLAGNGTIAVQQ
jgi:hypothetical protein